jgi:hypothetical protein
VKTIVTRTLVNGSRVYWPAPNSVNGGGNVPTLIVRFEPTFRLLMSTVRIVAGMPIPVAGKLTIVGTLRVPPSGSATGVGVGVAVAVPVAVIFGVGVGTAVAVAFRVGVGFAVAVKVAIAVAVGFAV